MVHGYCLLTSSFPLEPPIASKKGESSEKTTENTAPCIIACKKVKIKLRMTTNYIFMYEFKDS